MTKAERADLFSRHAPRIELRYNAGWSASHSWYEGSGATPEEALADLAKDIVNTLNAEPYDQEQP